MGPLMNIPLSDLRVIVQALCENGNIKNRVINFLAASEPYGTQLSTFPVNSVTLIQQASARGLSLLLADLCESEDTKKRVDKYLEALRYTEPAKCGPKAAVHLSTIENATAEHLLKIMLILCEDEDFKKRVLKHLRVLRQPTIDRATFVEAESIQLVTMATENELRAICLAMSDRDEDTKQRLLESLQVLSIHDKLRGSEALNTTFQCLSCKTSYCEENNTPNSCWYHPGRFSASVPGQTGLASLIAVTGRFVKMDHGELRIVVSRWSCCGRSAYDVECKTKKHHHR